MTSHTSVTDGSQRARKLQPLQPKTIGAVLNRLLRRADELAAFQAEHSFG
jgi:hypothetical protein